MARLCHYLVPLRQTQLIHVENFSPFYFVLDKILASSYGNDLPDLITVQPGNRLNRPWIFPFLHLLLYL